MKLHPALNKVYNYSLIKTLITEWTYNDTAHTKYDTLRLNFSMQATGNDDSTVTFRVIYNNFKWNSQVNYVRDSSYAKPINIVLNDSGSVEQVLNTDALLQDIVNDGSTKYYVHGALPDYISVNGVKDMFNKIFAILPVKKVGENDTWVRNHVMIAKAPVNISNVYALEHLRNDTATIHIQSFVSERQSEGDVTFLKGNVDGYAMINTFTGMPFLYDIRSDIVTTTNYYYIKANEHIVVTLKF
ncbi:MAG: DUF6263 family protein [Bacteroidota bacterium]|nr:DUF6263 family protein [Bacteroidota bacterium]